MRTMRPSFLLSLPERSSARWLPALAGVDPRVRAGPAAAVRPSVEAVRGEREEPAADLDRARRRRRGGRRAPSPTLPRAKELALRKGAGNVVELGSIAAFGFSPLWLLAAASDVAHGSRVYLAALTDELKAASVLAPEAEFGSVDELLGAFEGGSGTAARLIDIPPLELAELRAVGARAARPRGRPAGPGRAGRPVPRAAAAGPARGRSLLEVSQGIGLAFLLSAGKVSRDAARRALPRGLEAAARRGIRRLREARLGAVRARDRRPLRPRPQTWTERGLDKVSRVRRGA